MCQCSKYCISSINKNYSILRIVGHKTYDGFKINLLRDGDDLYCKTFKLY